MQHELLVQGWCASASHIASGWNPSCLPEAWRFPWHVRCCCVYVPLIMSISLIVRMFHLSMLKKNPYLNAGDSWFAMGRWAFRCGYSNYIFLSQHSIKDPSYHYPWLVHNILKKCQTPQKTADQGGWFVFVPNFNLNTRMIFPPNSTYKWTYWSAWDRLACSVWRNGDRAETS